MGNCQGDEMLQDTHVPQLGRLGPVVELKITNYIWERDYQGLFDYQSRQIRRHIYHIKNNGLLLTNNKQKYVQQISKQQYTQHVQSELYQILRKACFQIIKKTNYFKIEPIYIQNEQFSIQKLLWLIVKSVPHHRYQLKQKDIIKLGKQKVKIRQIVHFDNNSSVIHPSTGVKTNKKIYNEISFKLNPQEKHHEIQPKEDIVQEIQSEMTQNQVSCRICLQPGEYNNPLICACKCTGSIKYIHLNCLRTWLGKQLKIFHYKFSISIKWTPLACEMCKTHYKYRIYLDNKKFYTVQIPKPEKPYIVLEVMKKSSEYSKIFHFISFSQTSKQSIGRKKDIDIKISDDISISRHHANLIYDLQNKKFLLQDNKSKFGSLVLIKKNLIINPFQRGIGFQIGGEILMFQSIRGEGSIDDYKDCDQFLNVAEPDERGEAGDEQSDQNNDDDEQFEQLQEDQGFVQPNQHLNHIGSNISSLNAPQNNNHLEQINALPLQSNIQQPNHPPVSISANINNQPINPNPNSNNLQIVQLDQ